MMIAAIDRLVHHAIIFEMNVERYRRRVTLDRKGGARTAEKLREVAPSRLSLTSAITARQSAATNETLANVNRLVTITIPSRRSRADSTLV